jgi:hypothetical protein
VPETVSNTSPLIYLHLLRRLELLPLLFGKITTTPNLALVKVARSTWP